MKTLAQDRTSELPDGWQVERLGDACRIKTGKKDVNEGNPAGKYPFFTCSKEIHYSDSYSFDTEAILVAGNGAVGETKYFSGKFEAYQRTYVLDQFSAFAPYVFLFLKGTLVTELARLVTGSTMPYIRKGDLENIEFPVPPLPEQRKIAGVLGLVQRAMEQQERLIEKTAELKKTLLHQLFTQGTRGEPQKQTDLGPVPESWEVVKLSEVCTFISGGTPSKQRPDFWEGTIPWASPKDMKRPRLRDVPDHISDEALEDGSRLAPAGSIFVVIRGMILAKDVPVALAEVPMAFNQDMKAIIPGERISSAFLLYALGAFKRNLFEKVGRSAHGTMTLMSTEISSFAIPLPDRKTQDEIATAIETVETKLSHHRRKHATLSALFRTLLHQLMTAQLRVHDLELDGILEQAVQETDAP